MVLKKEKWGNILKETKTIQDTDVELMKKRKELCSKREQMRRLDAKVCCSCICLLYTCLFVIYNI